MRYSPTRLLHGLLYMAPVALLALAACGGGGGSTPPAPLAAAYTLSVNVAGVSGVGVVLRNNGGDDLTVTSPGTYDFLTQILSATSYNVTVLSHPSAPVQVCKVTNPSGTMPVGGTTVTVNCVDAFKINVSITGAASGIGPILQNNGGDDLFISAIASGVPTTYTFSAPVENTGVYDVTQRSRARSPGQNCDGTNGSVISNGTGAVSGVDVSVTITCTLAPIVPRFAYVANSTANTVSAYTISSGALTLVNSFTTGTQPYSVSVDPSGQFAYVANKTSGTISAYSIDTSINPSAGALTEIDQNGALAGTTVATGAGPAFITIHPSGKFAYVVSQINDTISAYSINTTSGALSAIDANGALAGTTIATGTTPYEVIVDPSGKYAYVANYDSNDISAYSIDQISGALTAVGAPVAAGTGPSSVAIDRYGKFLLVANTVSNDVMSYAISQTTGALTPMTTTAAIAGSAPRSVAIDPNTGVYAYVANAGNDTVAAYTIAADGTLSGGTTIAAGTVPFSVNVDPAGTFAYVANYGDGVNPGTVSVYPINQISGALTAGTAVAAGFGPASVTTSQ